MDALIVEIMQLALLLERQGKVVKLSWHSGSTGTPGSLLAELWPDRRSYQLWLDEVDGVDYFTKYTTYREHRTIGLQQILGKFREAAK